MFRRREQRAKRIQDYVIERLGRKAPQWTLEKIVNQCSVVRRVE